MSKTFKERPILFSGAMVRAILNGTKTQTRRIMKPQPELYHQNKPDQNKLVQWSWSSKDPRTPVYWCEDAEHNSKWWDFWDSGYSPYGNPVDRLWVRETWAISGWYKNPAGGDPLPRYEYRAFPADGTDFRCVSSWKPSIHMPRVASRLTLEIVSVRVERLQDISAEDAIAEGMPLDDAVYDYSRLWEKINGAGSWEQNPWVWVVEFKKLETPDVH